MKPIRPRLYQLGLFAFLALGAGVLYASWLAQNVEREAGRKESRHVTEQAGLRLREFLGLQLAGASVLTRTVSELGGPEQRTFEAHAENLHRTLTGLRAINWVDRDGTIRWVSPRETNLAAEGRSIYENPVAAQALEAARDAEAPRMTAPISLFQGGTGVAIYFPVMPPGEGVIGYVNAVFRVDELIEGLFGDNTLEDFELWIHDGSATVFRDGVDLERAGAELDTSRHEIQVLDRTWTLEFRPRPSAFGSPLGRFEPTLLVFGLIMAALLAGGLTQIVRVSYERQREVELRAELEGRLLQAQKMEAIGRLAGGVAHDFNNLLTAILGNADLIEGMGTLDERARASLAQIRIASERATQLTSQLLTISRRQVVQPRPIDLNQELRTLEGVLQRLIREDIRFVQALSESPCVVELDPGQLSQVIMNLVVNAVDAIEDGGTIVVRTERRRGEVEGALGDWVVLSIEDTGVGMNESTQRRALEPFFTTKAKGKGTGLGLATVDGIATGAGGVVRLVPNQPAGTRVQVWLPASKHLPEPPEPATESGAAGGGGVVLLVEDDPAVLRIGAGILEKDGYEVVEAHDGEQALALVDAGLEFDLLFTDAVMPGLGGRELLQGLRRRGRDCLAVITSGYPDELAARDLERLEAAFVCKPYTAATLREAIASAVEHRRRAPLPANEGSHSVKR